ICCVVVLVCCVVVWLCGCVVLRSSCAGLKSVVFAAHAQSVFARPRRANSFFIEELLQGDLERECYEEHCSYEEAREYFEDTPTAISFWTRYYDGDQCQPNPCLQGGNCTDRVGGFVCSCRDPHHGRTCEEKVRCAVDGPGSCHQFCKVWNDEPICSCTEGFTLQTDKKTCLPHGEWNRLSDAHLSVIITVLTGYNNVSSGGRAVSVLSAFLHRGFQAGLHDNDLVVLHLATPLLFGPSLFPLCLPTKDFSENVLMHAGSPGLTWLGSEIVTYVTLDACRRLLNTSQPISNKMFCMAGPPARPGPQDVERRWRASPVASRRHGTAFLTGLLLPLPPGGRGQGRGLLFTKLSRFLPWIGATLERIQRLQDEVPDAEPPPRRAPHADPPPR
uniref:Uncharacterized protein n=1 Tax=Gadus morhua TaxID=8049 RepID=A0A8C5FD57_GADMO